MRDRLIGSGQRRSGLRPRIWLSFLITARICIASGPADFPPQYVHTRWALRDGFGVFPVQALAQTSDGYLWLGTSAGLWRFDGAHYFHWEPRPGDPRLPSEDIRCLYAAPEGGLWIGTAEGIRKLDRARLWNDGARDDLFQGVRVLFADPDVALWAGMSGYKHEGLVRLRSGEATSFGAESGLPDSGVSAIFPDTDGRLWIGTRHALCLWQPGQPAKQIATGEVQSISKTSDGRLLVVSTPGGLQQLVNGRLESIRDLRHIRSVSLVLGDRNGGIWAGMFSDGLVHLHGGRVERLTQPDGLSGAVVESLLEDREGNIWVGTQDGLDRFRPAPVVHLSASDGLSEDVISTIEAGANGLVWAGTPSTGINQIDLQGTIRRDTPKGLPGKSVIALHRDAAGRLWAGTLSGLAVAEKFAFREVRTQNGEKLDRVTAIADARGQVWVADSRRGIYTVSGGVARSLAAPGMPSATDVYALIGDSHSRLWIGYYSGHIAMLDGLHLVNYDSRNGLASGPVLALYEDASGVIWAGTGYGLSRFRDGAWTTWTVSSGLPSAPVHEIIGDDFGGLWLSTPKGVVRLNTAALNAPAGATTEPLRFLNYGVAAGMRPQSSAVWAQPRSCKSADGRLWFATDDGIAIIDASRKPPGSTRLKLIIEQVKIDDRTPQLNPGSGELSFRGKQLQIDYTVPSLSSPNSIVFRYRLASFNNRWIDAGTHRQAYFTNLPPGHYQFQVAASNSEGVWDETRAVLDLNVLPAFHQTLLFRVSCALAACGILFAFYRFRVAQIARQLELGAEERFAERTRIARELHDTLLQTIVGISLQLDALLNRLPPASEPQKADLRGIRRQLDDALRGARRSVWALRAPALRERNFVSALKEIATALPAHTNFEASVIVEGKSYSCSPEAEEQLLRIAQAAIANAVQHSRGTRIQVQLIYAAQSITVRVGDNGYGIPPEFLGGRPGHFGLVGMRERAERIGARFAVTSQPGAGTSVSVVFPVRRNAESGPFAAVRNLPWRMLSIFRRKSIGLT